jgi:Alkaline phosphatase PhoX
VKRRALLTLLGLGAVGAVAVVANAGPPDGPQLAGVAANTKAVGYAPATQLSPGLSQIVAAQGSMKLENPQGIVTHYGYENDVSSPGDPNVPLMVPVAGGATEAQKTEPDKNTYLELKDGQPGADPNYNYGTHFLYQGHEAAATVNGQKQSYITRINLDADTAHRVTLLATQDTGGHPIATIDGSTWDPFSQRLLFTTESASAPTYAATLGYPSTVEDVSGALGRGGYEGIQDDGDGNLWIVEDIGGSNKPGTVAKIPNSFVYRYVPATPGDLHHGKLEALQVLNHGTPITQATQTALNAPDQVALHTYGNVFSTRWVTVHDTAVDGTTAFNANTAAKAKDATPFKRPENGVFRPGTKFGEFYFTETGDTNATSVENATAGGWGGLFRLEQSSPSAATGKISVFFKGSQPVTGLDNINFISRNTLGAVEDAGDTLHGQRNALDSAYAFDVNTDYSQGAQPVRWLAEGRDASATIDAGASPSGFGKNDGDNELTGLLVSDGRADVEGILGARNPNLGDHKWRLFYTQQHGDNITYEVLVG